MQLIKTAALAAILTSTAAAKDERTFAVLHFTNKQLTKGRIDPIVNPGVPSAHVHTVMGGSGFSMTSTGASLKESKCTNAQVKGDFSNYWFPSLYFHDEAKGTFEEVEIFYVNAYYFFEATNDKITAFPTGLQMLSGDAMRRTVPEGADQANLDASKGPVNPARFTCPRSNFDPPSWPKDSDGSMAGVGDVINQGEGTGFPFAECDGYAAPLRADVHFPSCYDPSAGLTNYKNNMGWPKDAGSGKNDCPEGWIHTPHLFIEAYWNTPLFKDRWTPGQHKQPFVLSNGDVTGFSQHADFMAAWDEPLLQHIIDTCDTGGNGMENCEGLFYGKNTEDCTIESEIDEVVDGVLSKLPGNNALAGWQYGTSGMKSAPSASAEPIKSEEPTKSSTSAGLPDVSDVATNVVENPAVSSSTKAASAPAPTKSAAKPSGQPKPKPTSAAGSCNGNVQTVYKTVTVTEGASPEPTAGAGNSTGSVAGFKYAGCFKDASERVLRDVIRANIGDVSNEKCVTYCKGAGFALAGTEYGGECYCGNELVGSSQIDESSCSDPCSGDSADICGGGWALSVYSESGEASMKSAKARRHMHGHMHNHRRSS